MRRLCWAMLAACLLAFACPPAIVRAAPNRCTVRVTPVTFPPYNPLSSFGVWGRGAVSFKCSQSHPIMVLLGASQGGPATDRRMRQGRSALRYNLCLDAGCEVIWGDGSGGSQFYSNPAPPAGTRVTVPIYGRIPARQTHAKAGLYEDSLVVTTIF